MPKETLVNRLKEQNISVEVDFEKLEEYYSLLKEWNEKIDLTNIIEEDEVYLKHFLDSLTLFKIPEFNEKKTLVDIGTGAGFPGIVLKTANDSLDITLLDSLNKRLIFLDEVINELNLENIKTVHTRGEEAGLDDEFREKFDIGVSRAVSRLNKLAEISLPLIKVGGIFVAMKGKNTKEEITEGEIAIEELGGKIREVIEFELIPGDHERTLVVIEKISPTPKKYPRPFGKIKNSPLKWKMFHVKQLGR